MPAVPLKVDPLDEELRSPPGTTPRLENLVVEALGLVFTELAGRCGPLGSRPHPLHPALQRVRAVAGPWPRQPLVQPDKAPVRGPPERRLAVAAILYELQQECDRNQRETNGAKVPPQPGMVPKSQANAVWREDCREVACVNTRQKRAKESAPQARESHRSNETKLSGG